MSILKLSLKLSVFITALALAASAEAGLYGFEHAHPITHEEEILNMDVPPLNIPNYRDLMRQNINMLIKYAHAQNPDFQIMLHEGEELFEKSIWEYHLDGYNKARAQGIDTSDPSFLTRLNHQSVSNKSNIGTKADSFRRNIDAVVLNNLYCSQRKADPHIRDVPLKIVSVSQCPNLKAYEEAAALSASEKVLFYGFIQPSQAFKHILKQPIINENARNIFKISEASNISFLIDDSGYTDKLSMIKDIRNSNYDIIVINPLFHNRTPFEKDEVDSMKYKKNGTQRLVIAVQNVSEASAGAYYWQDEWEIDNPAWLKRLSFSSQEGIITEYWNENWQKIMSEYFKSIILSSYDGVFFTGAENHRYFEIQTPLE